MNREARKSTHTSREHEAVAMQKRYRKLYDSYRQSLHYVYYSEPVRDGYKRIYILRADIATSPQATFMEKLLAKINTPQYSKNKEFTYYPHKWSRSKEKRKLKEPVPHILTAPHNTNFTPKELAYFEIKQNDRKKPYYEFTKHWMLAEHVTINWVTKSLVGNEEMQEEMDDIINKLYDPTGKYYRYVVHYKDKWWEDELERITRKNNKQIMKEAYNEIQHEADIAGAD